MSRVRVVLLAFVEPVAVQSSTAGVLVVADNQPLKYAFEATGHVDAGDNPRALICLQPAFNALAEHIDEAVKNDS